MGSLTVPEDVRWSLLQEGGYKSLSLRPAEVWQFELPPDTGIAYRKVFSSPVCSAS